MGGIVTEYHFWPFLFFGWAQVTVLVLVYFRVWKVEIGDLPELIVRAVGAAIVAFIFVLLLFYLGVLVFALLANLIPGT